MPPEQVASVGSDPGHNVGRENGIEVPAVKRRRSDRNSPETDLPSLFPGRQIESLETAVLETYEGSIAENEGPTGRGPAERPISNQAAFRIDDTQLSVGRPVNKPVPPD